MALDLASLIDEMKVLAPIGLELPRHPDDNTIYEPTIERWAEDAAEKINARRKKTTRKEVVIVTVEGEQDYELPEDCREVVKIDRKRITRILDVPIQPEPMLGHAMGARLPTGQEVTASLDLIQRQRRTRFNREDEFELVGGQIRMLFPILAGESVLVTYRAVDRSLESVPADKKTLVITYMLFQNLDFVIQKLGAQPVVRGDRFDESTMAVFARRRGELEKDWIAGLNAIGPEAN